MAVDLGPLPLLDGLLVGPGDGDGAFRAQRLAMAAQKAGADLLVASLGENVQYVSGYYCMRLRSK